MILLLIIPACYLCWVAFSRPFRGLLLIFALNPLESFVHLPEGISIGRSIAMMTMIGWAWKLNHRGGALRNVSRLRTVKVVMPFVLVCWVGLLLSDPTLRGVLSVTTISLLAIMSMMVEDLVNDEKRLNLLLWVVALSAALVALWPVAARFGLDLPGMEASADDRATGIETNANGLGLILNTAIFLLTYFLFQVRSLWKALCVSMFIAFSMLGLILSGSRTHFFGMVAFFFFLAALRLAGPRKGLIRFVTCGILAAVLLSLAIAYAPDKPKARVLMSGERSREDAQGRNEFRRVQQEMSLEFLKEDPLFGIGIGNFVLREAPGIRQADAHDTVSALLGETGATGTVLFLVILWFYFKSIYRKMRSGSALGNMHDYYLALVLLAMGGSMLVSSFGGYIMFYQRLFWLMVGIAAVIAQTTTMPIAQQNHVRSSGYSPFAR